VGWEQFGYHVDTFKYCRYLRERFDLTYLCVDEGLPKKHLDGVQVVFCGRPVLGKIEPRLVLDTGRLLKERRFDLVFVQRSKFAFLSRLLHPTVPMIFDVRTGSIERSSAVRTFQNAMIRWNARFFKHITVISEGLAEQLRLPGRAMVLPLGADRTAARAIVRRDELRLVYIGTLTNRHLHRTIEGLGLFASQNKADLPFSYTLVGFGSRDDWDRIEDSIRTNGLESKINIRDRIDHDDVPMLLSEHNVGIGFTPRVPWYEFQPSTKIFEYLQSGLLCLATDSAANREVVTSGHGVLIGDSPEDFCSGLQSIVGMLPSWQPEEVVESVMDKTWEEIVRRSLVPIVTTTMGEGAANGGIR